MPRLLPWLAKEDPHGRNKNKHDNSIATPERKSFGQRTTVGTPSSVASSHGGNRIGRQEQKDTSATAADFLRSSRSPPTSPIASPPTEEYLIPGFENDDQYIMVEDEFYAMAQQFTRHLHHAEYVRRKKQAKKMGASVLREIDRPTDGRTPMSKEMLKRKQGERLHQRQKEGLESGARRPEDSDEEASRVIDEGEEEEEEREDDPWYGTSLHTFMTSPRKNKSLMGLEQIRSKTRAAAGFRSEIATRTPARSLESGTLSRQGPSGDLPSTPSSDDDDDLEVVASRSAKHSPLPRSGTRVRTSTTNLGSSDFDKERTSNPGQQADALRKVAFDAGQTSHSVKDRRQTAETLKEDKRNETLSTGSVNQVSTKFKIPSTLNRPRKRLFLDDWDDIVATGDTTDSTPNKSDIIQDQPGKVSGKASTLSATEENLHAGRAAPKQMPDRDKAAKKSRMNDIPTFLV